MAKHTQTQRIFDALKRGEILTVRRIFNELHINSPTARIGDLRRRGVNVKDRTAKLPSGEKIKEYFL